MLQERTALVALLAHLAEFDERKLYAELMYPSLFAYCVRELRYSEQATAKRVYTARAVRKYPIVLQMIEKTELTMAGVMILAPHLTPENHADLLSRARGMSSRDIEGLVALIAPRREVRECIRLSAATPAIIRADNGSASEAPSPDEPAHTRAPAPHRESRQDIDLFAPGRAHFGFNASTTFLAKYERAREILRHKYPSGTLEEIMTEALEALLDEKDPDRRQSSRKPAPPGTGPSARWIPRAVKDEVWARDKGRCVFPGPAGGFCGERGGLEFDHVKPFALGGRSDDPTNIRLLCRAHNQLTARRVFGEHSARNA